MTMTVNPYTSARSKLGDRLRHAVRAITGPGPYYDANGIIVLSHLAEELDAVGDSPPLFVPTRINGNGIAVSQRAERVLAEDVQAGDILLLDGYVSKVTGVNPMNLSWRGQSADWAVLHITGQTNIVRFPHETVSVIRKSEEAR